MYLFENPVLQRELLVNLRMPRAFVLLLLYQILLAAVVYFAWPKDNLRIDLTKESTSTLVDLFFLGQYILASLMAPSFAAGAIAGGKRTSDLRNVARESHSPRGDCNGQTGRRADTSGHPDFCLVTHRDAVPSVGWCLVLRGPRRLSCADRECYYIRHDQCCLRKLFPRTSSALVVSYLTILPMALIGILFWSSLSEFGELRFKLAIAVIPGIAAAITIALFYICSARMLYPPDFGSEGKEVVDLEQESAQAVGLVIQRDQFPDRLFAPPKRETLMEDGTNPVYDKEMRSEIFGQGTLMLRLAIQISMVVAIPVMAWCLYIKRHLAPWYISYVVLFNILIGPVFSAGSVTSERERQTLDLLLTTVITPWQILWANCFRFTCLKRPLFVLTLASVSRAHHGWRVLGKFSNHSGVHCDLCFDMFDDGNVGTVLLDAVPSNEHQLDGDLYGHLVVVRCADGRQLFGNTYFPRRMVPTW